MVILYRDGEGVLHCIAFVSWCSNLQHVWLQIVQPDYGMQKQGSVYSNTWAIMDQVHTCIELNWFCMLSTLPCKLGVLIFIAALNGTADFEFILLFICNCYCRGDFKFGWRSLIWLKLLSPRSDQDVISPYNIHTITSRKVMRMKKNIN